MMSLRNDHEDHHAVVYCCGLCGYELHLSSADRDTSGIGSGKYGRDLQKGVVSFNSIDETRFSHDEELKIRPFFNTRRSWGLLRRRTRLHCRKCRHLIGFAYDETSWPVASDSSVSSSIDGTATGKKYSINIRALQPAGGESGDSFIV